MRSDHLYHSKRMAPGILAVGEFNKDIVNLDEHSLIEPLKRFLGLISKDKATLSLETPTMD